MKIPGFPSRAAEGAVQALVWLVWMILLALVIPALAAAQECRSYSEGDPVRYVLSSSPGRRTGELIALRRNEMTVRTGGLVRRIPYARLRGAEVKCTLLAPRRRTAIGGVAGVILGLVAGLVVANNQEGADRDRGGVDVWIPLGMAAAGGAAGGAVGSRWLQERGWTPLKVGGPDLLSYLPRLSPGPGGSVTLSARIPLPRR